MKINPDLRIKTTGIKLKTGGFFRFRVLQRIANNRYLILSSGQRFTVKSPVCLLKEKSYEAQLKDKNGTYILEKIHPLKKEDLSSPIKDIPHYNDNESGQIIPVPQENSDIPFYNRYELLDKAIVEESAKELFLLEPLIIIFKEKEYSGTLSLNYKKYTGTKIFTLNLKKNDIFWKFTLNSINQDLGINAFCNRLDVIEERQENWVQLCKNWKSLGIRADKSIKILRSPSEKAENNRGDVDRIIDIEV